MPMYEYRCSECGHTEERFFQINDPERDQWDNGEMMHPHRVEGFEDRWDGSGTMRRVYTSFAVPSNPFGDGYFDHGVGAFVSSKRELDDINKAKSEAHTARTGVETNFVAHRIEDAAPRMGPEV